MDTTHPAATLLAAARHIPHTVKCASGLSGWGCSFNAGLHGQAVAGQSHGLSTTTILVLLIAAALILALIVRSRRARSAS